MVVRLLSAAGFLAGTLATLPAAAQPVAAQPVGPATADVRSDAEPRALADIDGSPISEARFLDSYARRLMVSGAPDTAPGRAAHLRRLIDAALLADEARRLGIDQQPDAVRMRDRLARHATGGEWYGERLLAGLAAPDEAEVAAAYALASERVALRHLLFRTEAEAHAALAQLAAGRDLVDLANEVFETEAPTPEAGWLGEAGYWDLDDALADAVFALPVSAVSAPVQSAYGWHLLRVEARSRQPVLTDDAFQRARASVAERLRQRQARVEGRAFVRAFMDGQDVSLDEAAVRALRATMGRLRGSERRGALTADEAAEIASALDPSAVLATFGPAGDRQRFTVDDYLLWLPALPISEAIGRTGASVGRALRNEALSRAGAAAGLDTSAGVREHVRHQENALLADRMRALIRSYAPADNDLVPVAYTRHPLDEWASVLHAPTDAEVREGFDRLGYAGAPSAVRADLSYALAASQADAEAMVASGSWHADALVLVDADLSTVGEVGAPASAAHLGVPVAVGTASGWVVLRVDRRESVPTRFVDVEGEIRDRLAEALPAARLLRALRARAAVSVDAGSPALAPPGVR